MCHILVVRVFCCCVSYLCSARVMLFRCVVCLLICVSRQAPPPTTKKDYSFSMWCCNNVSVPATNNDGAPEHTTNRDSSFSTWCSMWCSGGRALVVPEPKSRKTRKTPTSSWCCMSSPEAVSPAIRALRRRKPKY